MKIKVIGAGLAGSEAAFQLAERGFDVQLYEQKGIKRHAAFKTDDFAELICSNSLRSDDLYNAVGLLKEEMRILHSLIMEAADLYRIPAGKSLAVDRKGFSQYITDRIRNHPNITVISEEVTQIDEDIPTIIAAGPLCEGKLADRIAELCGKDFLHFYDAVSPIVEKDSIDFDHAYFKSRYDEESEATLRFAGWKDDNDNISKTEITVPSIEKQRKIVETLDRFDRICNDISDGLPAEIEARQKQYEYYRDKLLTFKEKE